METGLSWETKEKLIEIVRKYECLYNVKHKDYKNKVYKTLLWERIGTLLEIEGKKAKETWRTLRDGYVRYKKQIAGKTGSGRKYFQYAWSAQMAFLDGTLELRPTITNITAPQEATHEPPQSQILREISPSAQLLSPQPGPSYAETPPSPWTSYTAPTSQLPLHTEPSNAGTPLSSGTPNTTSSIQLPVSSSVHTNNQSLPPPREQSTVKKRKNDLEERTDKILEYLQNKNRKRQEYDEVDHLFASYAKSFKKLSRRRQAELKLTLAKVFAEAELTELDNHTQTNESPQSQLVYLSPQYSIISDESTQHVILAQEIPDLQEPILAVDLTPPAQLAQDIPDLQEPILAVDLTQPAQLAQDIPDFQEPILAVDLTQPSQSIDEEDT